jgi:hypothetical protein
MGDNSAAAKDCIGEVNLKKNLLPEHPLGVCCALLLHMAAAPIWRWMRVLSFC